MLLHGTIAASLKASTQTVKTTVEATVPTAETIRGPQQCPPDLQNVRELVVLPETFVAAAWMSAAPRKRLRVKKPFVQRLSETSL